ncbi:type II secretion system F family protein [Egibacter rhizosphaerae]|uniref:Type II secretion system F family protein n=1 Tax=Egibacter rhizosphaerae TaxID=1670831 RepID=A0A411YJY5_9ACTN|nr:type II secretion system F family protein [Egibacter rhizosphaerae]QBI21512.1 type II secretion system F family protein [Egibacter rhizosphaerae]
MATATFDYTVRDQSGKTLKGSLDGPDQRAVAAKLREMGYSPISVQQQKSSTLHKEVSIPGLSGRIKLQDLAVFSRQFATMINSGLSLVRALNILAEQTENRKLAEIVGVVRGQIEQGRSLSDSLADHPDVFPKLYVAMVRAGETAGMLDQVLLRVANTLEKDLELRRKIKTALTYPVVVVCLAILLTAAMLIFIVPVFVDMFEDLGGELPLPTQILLFLSDILRSWWFLILPLPIVAWQLFKQARKDPKVRYQLDRLKLKVPVFGDLFHKIALARFNRNFGTLLRAGVPILSALEITADTVNNGVISDAVKDVQTAVKEGESVARPLSQHAVFPPMTVQMIAVGEETGAMDEMLEKIADFYDDEVATTTESLTAMLEPLMIMVLGGIVGAMVIALYMPMFEIFDLVDSGAGGI